MSTSASMRALLSTRDTRELLLKWIPALLFPLAFFTFYYGEIIINSVISPETADPNLPADGGTLIQLGIFIAIFYLVVIALAGYLIAIDSGRRSITSVWLDVLFFAVVPLILIIVTANLIFGLALCTIVWAAYLMIRNWIQKVRGTPPIIPSEVIKGANGELRMQVMQRAIIGSVSFATIFALLWFVVDLVFYFVGLLSNFLFAIAIARTVLLPIVGYGLGLLSGIAARRHLLSLNGNGGNGEGVNSPVTSKRRRVAALSQARAQEEAKDLVPNDLPLHSSGARRFYLALLIAFALFYPVLDPYLFGYGTDGRLVGYGDAGYYIILALGLNIVVGFAGLLDLGYVAFFAIGAYTWGLIGSSQLTVITGIPINPQIWPWLFWPMLLITALIAALWGVLLGAPTLRLRGDYLAIVTLGFGEIVPLVFLNLDKYTNGVNGVVGIFSPAFPGIQWSSITPAPYYYLILALIVLCIFANVRLRDSRLGRAWIAIREDEIAAASSGVNLVNTKLFAFAAGAFFSGIAGAFRAAKLGSVAPDAFSFGDSVIYLAMVVIGGIGSIPGVIVGAIAVYAINQLILAQLDAFAADPNHFMHPISLSLQHIFPGFTFGNIRNLVFGVILVIIMIFRPEGLLPSARRKRELHRVGEEQAEVSSLDAVPGSPGFEAEVRVE
jgi:ABC-type branched-subunit amino acid transport system permease subunit